MQGLAAVGCAFDGYEVVDYLGAGTFAHVYAVEFDHPLLGRQRRALKVFRSELGRHSPRRVLDELRAHNDVVGIPYLLTAFQSWQVTGGPFDGAVVSLLELADESLHDRLSAGMVTSEDALVVAHHVARGLDGLHQAGRVHGDLKPGNVLRTGMLWKVGDFSLTQRLADSAVDSGGTPRFFSPERRAARGRGERLLLTSSDDVYALGLILRDILERAPGPTADLAGLVDLAGRCLAEQAADRPAAIEVARAAEQLDFQAASALLAAAGDDEDTFIDPSPGPTLTVVGAPRVSVRMLAKLVGSDDPQWRTVVAAEPGSRVELLVEVANMGEADARDVIVAAATLPRYTSYEPGSTRLHLPDRPHDPLRLEDRIHRGGVNVGSLAADQTSYVRFVCRVDPLPAYPRRGIYRVSMVGLAKPREVNPRYNTAMIAIDAT